MRDHVNLLPWGYRRACLVRRRLRQWSVAWSVVGFGLALAWAEERSQWQAALDRMERDERRYDEVRLLKTKISRLTAEAQGLSKRKDFVSRLQQAPPPLLPLALVSTSASRCEGRVAVRQMVYSQETSSAPPIAGPSPTPPGVQPPAKADESETRHEARLTIDGFGADNLAIAAFVLGLRESEAFDRVDLKSAGSNSGDVVTYQVECGL